MDDLFSKLGNALTRVRQPRNVEGFSAEVIQGFP
jgi:hypothetical protein